MKKKYLYYIAHGCLEHQRIREWQLKMQEKYGVELRNPFYNETRIENMEGVETEEDLENLLNQLTPTECARIMNNDLGLIRHSDGLIVLLEEATIGTSMEIFAAAYLYDLNVYVVTQKYQNHPWIVALVMKSCGRIFNSLEELEKELFKTGDN